MQPQPSYSHHDRSCRRVRDRSRPPALSFADLFRRIGVNGMELGGQNKGRRIIRCATTSTPSGHRLQPSGHSLTVMWPKVLSSTGHESHCVAHS